MPPLKLNALDLVGKLCGIPDTFNIKYAEEEFDLPEPKICHCIDPSGKGGVTIAYRVCKPEYKGARMVEVALAYCSPSDRFNKEVGRQLALHNYYSRRTVTVPARNKNQSLSWTLRVMFWYTLK